MSSADLVVLRLVPEATIGVTPATPALEQIRYTGESLNYNIENTKTAEITPTRAETDLVQTGAQGAGDINFELSFGSFKKLLGGLFCADWTAGVGDIEYLVNGTTRKPFTIQKHFQDMAVPQFHNFKGCVVESMDLKMELGKIVEGSFSFMSFGVTVATAQIAGATFPAVSDTTPMNAVTNLQNLTIAGVPYSGCISMLGLNIKNNVRPRKCIGSIQPTDMKLGTLEVTGDIEFYFSEGSNFTNYVNGTEFDIAFDLIDIDGNKYNFEIPRAKFETGEVVAGGKNTDVMLTAKWRGLYDSTDARVIRLTSDPA